MEDVVVRGVSLDKNQAKVTVWGLPDQPGRAARIFNALSEATINVDMIVQNASHAGGNPATDLTFTVDKPDLTKAGKVLESLRAELGFREVSTDESIGKVSIVGVGMRSHSGVAARMFTVLAAEGVNIGLISTSEIKISVVIDLASGEKAMRALHQAFLEGDFLGCHPSAPLRNRQIPACRQWIGCLTKGRDFGSSTSLLSVHPHRTVGGDRYHRHPGRHASAGAGQGED
jgi:predicted amino acid-binding ACT domain protein